MQTTWVDFKELRENLQFEAVLRHYNVEVKRKGDQHHGFCPLPNHRGNKNSPSFSAHLTRGIFQCFGCGAKGNVLEFAAMMQNVDPKDHKALRTVAVSLQERFCYQTGNTGRIAKKPVLAISKPESKRQLPVVVNAPLDFELKGLYLDHPYLLKRGFNRKTIVDFGLGFCSRGFLKDRIAIPLHDQEHRVVGYAGRLVDENAINDENPRYRLPGTREREGAIHEFKKSLFLYNGFRIVEPVDDLVVVESFTATWWLHQHGYRNVVATMGADCSSAQSDLIVRLVKSTGHVWLLSDGDEAGARLAGTCLFDVSQKRFVRFVKLDEGRQPTDLSSAELRKCLTV